MRFRPSLMLVLLLTVAGCQPRWDDQVELTSQVTCFIDCPAQIASFGAPIATGSYATLRVSNADRLPPFTVASDDESVLSFTHHEATEESSAHVIATAHAAGSARLIFRDVDGRDIDERAFEVHDVARLSVTHANDRLLLATGGTLKRYVDLRDADGRLLFGYGAVAYTTSGEATLTSALEQGSDSEFSYPLLEQVTVSGVEPGPSTIEARAGDASATFEVEFVDASSLASLELHEVSYLTAVGVSARAVDVDGVEIHDPLCRWEFEPADLEYRVMPGRNGFVYPDDPEAVGTVTCRVGALRASVYVSP